MISNEQEIANFTCLLESMAQVGEGAKRAGKRRSWERVEEERMRRDRQAQWLARVRGWAWCIEDNSLRENRIMHSVCSDAQ